MGWGEGPAPDPSQLGCFGMFPSLPSLCLLTLHSSLLLPSPAQEAGGAMGTGEGGPCLHSGMCVCRPAPMCVLVWD